MLKPAGQNEPGGERPVGELVHQLVEEGKAYARAEIGLAKAIAAAKGKALALPAGLFFGALLFAQAAVVALAIGVFAVLHWLLGALLAGLVTLVIFLGVAGGLTWYGVQRLRRDL